MSHIIALYQVYLTNAYFGLTIQYKKKTTEGTRADIHKRSYKIESILNGGKTSQKEINEKREDQKGRLLCIYEKLDFFIPCFLELL